ncbi:MAG: DUF2961 domain-containing protein [Planctomycetota bacterium]|nr:MAG: DUF2961 domain-containing protein [Planctomycetota bacterium]
MLLELLLLAQTPSPQTALRFEDLLEEMVDLEALARWPNPEFHTIQFSSTDRRSRHPDAPGWYQNADGFGKEPVPGFEATLEAPGEDGVGLYLIADVQGPGAIVRGWSAGMGGTLRVYLDGRDQPLYQGPAYDFLANRTQIFLRQQGHDLNLGDAFRQQDADYLPVPFGQSLRVTWQGKVQELHFYHLEVRRYAAAAVAVETFDPARHLAEPGKLVEIARRLRQPSAPETSENHALTASLKPDGIWSWTTPLEGAPKAFRYLSLRLQAADLDAALRGTLLRIAFDGSQRPQVEAPVGDFAGTGPGVHPYHSLPMAMTADGTVICRFVMPFQNTAKLQLWNTTAQQVDAEIKVGLSPWQWDAKSLYFRAKWRMDPDLDLRFGGFDLPFIVLIGRGRLVGVASLLSNPASVPHPYGSWWGEGDEKIFVDGEATPSFLGTGSEDYYNYSWSRPDLFDHPYCGQPANTGPGNQGICTNHRWQILDNLLFRSSLSFHMEMWHHRPKAGLAYARLAYIYARPGAVDDHRRVQASELIIPQLPVQPAEAAYGSHGAEIHPLQAAEMEAEGGQVKPDSTWPTAADGRLVGWSAAPGDRLQFTFESEKDGEAALHLVACHRPDGGKLRVWLGDQALQVEGLGGAEFGESGSPIWTLQSRHARRLLSTRFKPLKLAPGKQRLTIECLVGGEFGFDYLWIR